MKKALITGITGQDGSYLAELLLSKGYEVHGVIRRASSFNTERIDHIYVDPHNPKAKLFLHYGDLSSFEQSSNIISNICPDEVYNLGAQSHVKVSFDMPEYTGDVTGLGTTRILEAIRISRKKIKFYQASSSEMFGAAPAPQNENTYFAPRSPYAAAKAYAHFMTVNYRQGYNIFASNGILFNHECISENTPLIIRKDKIITIKRPKDIKRPKPKGKSIQQWILGDIEIWDGNEFVALECMTATKRKKDNDDFVCKIINTKGGLVEVTNHHTMIDENGNKIKAKDIKIESDLLHKNFPQQQEISAISLEEARFLGMMVGDGWIGENGKANFCCNNKKIMDEFEQLWKKVGHGTILCRIYNTEYGISTRTKLNGNSEYLNYIRNQLYTKDGFKKVPDRILNASKEVKLAFLDGYNKTDGLKSNPCTYIFKNFKTNSSVLAQGLIFLIKQTTGQKFNITFESDSKYYGYYSINLLSPIDRLLKEKKVKKLLKEGCGQRQINRDTGVSRTFIRKIEKGGKAVLVHPLSKPKNRVKKILFHKKQPEWVFDIETRSGKFMAGVGTMVISNSPRRGETFVTRKITRAVANILAKKQDKLYLGNLAAKRDWGYAPEYVQAMYQILQKDEPGNYVIGTGKAYSVENFLKEVFDYAKLDYKKYLKIDKKYFRPTDVESLLADPKKAKKELKWKPKITLSDLAKIMLDSDMRKIGINPLAEGDKILAKKFPNRWWQKD